MSKWARPVEEVKLDISYANGEEIDIIEYLKTQAKLRWKR